jgi:hypothetical protein
VGGYNTSQALNVFQQFGIRAQPDAVVLGYVLNDAEPALFHEGSYSGLGVRRRLPTEQILADASPPHTLLFKLRTTTLLWRFFADRTQSRRVADYYRSLYDEQAEGWVASKSALIGIAELCAERRIPFIVVVFPMLVQLEDQYPYLDIHARVCADAKSVGATVIDLLPALNGRRAEELWVHPTDQHPNEQVHAVAANLLKDTLLDLGISARSPQPRDPPGN